MAELLAPRRRGRAARSAMRRLGAARGRVRRGFRSALRADRAAARQLGPCPRARRRAWPDSHRAGRRSGRGGRSGCGREGERVVPDTFTLTATDGEARAGVIHTAHGDVPTPVFMPVGTKGTVKAVDPDELGSLGVTIVLGNTYHLHFRPGAEAVADLGGLHRFMGWDGPILTDSGGFQVFSLRDTLLACDEDGVTFRSVYDGEKERFTPESVAGVQALLGSDIAMCLDVCPPTTASQAEAERAVEVTTAWARRQAQAPRVEGQLLFGIAQGGV